MPIIIKSECIAKKYRLKSQEYVDIPTTKLFLINISNISKLILDFLNFFLKNGIILAIINLRSSIQCLNKYTYRQYL